MAVTVAAFGALIVMAEVLLRIWGGATLLFPDDSDDRDGDAKAWLCTFAPRLCERRGDDMFPSAGDDAAATAGWVECTPRVLRDRDSAGATAATAAATGSLTTVLTGVAGLGGRPMPLRERVMAIGTDVAGVLSCSGRTRMLKSSGSAGSVSSLFSKPDVFESEVLVFITRAPATPSSSMVRSPYEFLYESVSAARASGTVRPIISAAAFRSGVLALVAVELLPLVMVEVAFRGRS